MWYLISAYSRTAASNTASSGAAPRSKVNNAPVKWSIDSGSNGVAFPLLQVRNLLSTPRYTRTLDSVAAKSVGNMLHRKIYFVQIENGTLIALNFPIFFRFFTKV